MLGFFNEAAIKWQPKSSSCVTFRQMRRCWRSGAVADGSRARSENTSIPAEDTTVDVSAGMISWCQRHLQARLPTSHFTWVDVYSPDQNPGGSIEGATFVFPYADCQFDAAVVSSVFTHIMPDEIERYISELARVLKPDGRCFITAFLFDEEAEAAVARGATIFDFRHRVGPCLTFDYEHPEAGIACNKDWLLGLVDRFGLEIDMIRSGTWRFVRSYEIFQDYVVTTKRKSSDIDRI